MKLRPKLPFLCLLFLFLSVGFSLYLSKSVSLEKRKVYFLPQAKYLKAISGSHKHLAASLFFVKGVLDISEKIPQRIDYLLDVFRTSVKLDPRLVGAYVIGGVVVPKTKQDIVLAIDFLKEGMELNPKEWRIPFWIGFNNLELSIYPKVIEYYQLASELPDSPRYLKSNLAYYYYKSDKPKEGLLYLQTLKESLEDERLIKSIEQKITWLENIAYLEAKVKVYKDTYQSWPDSLDDLVRVGLISEIPEDPFGGGYELGKDWYRGQGRVKSKLQL